MALRLSLRDILQNVLISIQKLLNNLFKYRPLMISPPIFSGNFDGDSLVGSKSLEVGSSEQLPCSPESYTTSLRSLFDLLEKGILLVQSSQVSQGLCMLEQLLERINLNRNMIATIDKNGSECSYWRLQFAALYHVTCAYSILGKEAQILNASKKLIELMRVVKKDPKYQLAKITKENFQKFAKNTEQYTSGKGKSQSTFSNAFMENNLKFHILYAKFLLFSCFKLSRIQEHEEAFTQAREAKDILTNIFQCLDLEDNTASSKKINTHQKVQFKRIIGNRAHPVLQQIRKDIEISDTESSETLKMIRTTISCWRRNPQHSKKDLKAVQNNEDSNFQFIKHQTADERSILGVRSLKQNNPYQSKDTYLNPECIKDIINLQSISFQELCRLDNIIFELTSDKLKQKLHLLCASYFCMGIELWNIEEANHVLMGGQSSTRARKPVQKETVQGQTSNQELFKFSEFYLLKALGIIVSYMRDCESLLDNLVEVFQRKFQGEMVTITQQNSIYEMSASLSELRKSTKYRLSHRLLEKELERQQQQRYRKLNDDTTSYDFDAKPEQIYYAIGKETSRNKSKGRSSRKLFAKYKKKSVDSLKQFKEGQLIQPSKCKSPQPFRMNIKKPKQESSSQISSPRGNQYILTPQKKLRVNLHEGKKQGQKTRNEDSIEHQINSRMSRGKKSVEKKACCYSSFCSQNNISWDKTLSRDYSFSKKSFSKRGKKPRKQ